MTSTDRAAATLDAVQILRSALRDSAASCPPPVWQALERAYIRLADQYARWLLQGDTL